MAAPGSQTRPPSIRKPLGEATDRANINGTPPRHAHNKLRATSSLASTGLPHHESLMPNGGHTVQNIKSSPNNKRLSALSAGEVPDSKRNSQVSTTSTNASSKGRKKKTHIGPWQLGSDIGKGGVGKVRRVRHSLTGEDAAVKIIPKKVAEEACATSLANLVESSKKAHAGALATGHLIPFGVEREIVIMKLLEHPNIVRLYDVWENRNELYLIMEYVNGGELFEYITDWGYLGEDETVWLFRQMVAALLHCHGLGIHHRDLKPENILLDRKTLRVKIADFGMAALQPRGRLLTTPCGSIHYAAPEVFERSYDGRKADVWSLGIILYVMLTGTTPFQYDLATMQREHLHWHDFIKSSQIPIPDEMSIEAKDLICSMLRPDPKSRISLDLVWKHPFMHKHRVEWGETEESAKLENWIGPTPSIENWSIKQESDVDREILRNLRTLWHSDEEKLIIQKLLDKEFNLEKYFYSALEKHREEQLENYVGNPDGVGYSASDHHHIKPVDTGDLPPLPRNAFTRTKSQFSILSDEQHHSKSSLQTRPVSIGSYDPFRASRDRIVGGKESHLNVTVHRGTSRQSRKQDTTNVQRHPGSMRVEALRKQQRRLSASPSAVSLKKASPLRSSATYRRSISRSSLANPLYPSSPPVASVVKVNITHKRGVNFSHVRKSSNMSGRTTHSTSEAVTTPQKQKTIRLSQHDSVSDLRRMGSSPAVHGDQLVRSRKAIAATGAPRSEIRQSQTEGQVIENEARKVSTELEAFIDQAFNRTSAASSNRTSLPSNQSPYDTPPSSISNRGSAQSAHLCAKPLHQEESTNRQHPLPVLPLETPNTFIARELAETRKRFAARYAADENAQNDNYHEVLAHLDALLQPNSAKISTSDNRRHTSAPETRSPEYSGYLPIISEENKSSDADDSYALSGSASHRTRPTTDAFEKSSARRMRSRDPQGTIRLIEQSSPPRIAPLVIRKASSISSGSQPSNDSVGSQNNNGIKPVRKLTPTSPGSLGIISEEAAAAAKESAAKMSDVDPPKKKNWFRRRLHDVETDKQKTEAPRRLREPDVRAERPMKSSLGATAIVKSDSNHGSLEESLESQPAAVRGKRPGFLRFLRKAWTPRKDEEGRMMIGVRDEDDEAPSITSTSVLSTSSRLVHTATATDIPSESAGSSPHWLGIQRNWLARFLNIKPASRTLCFCVGRGKARQEIVRLLRSWRSYGMRDVELDRQKNLVYARVGKDNKLGLKEVAFVVELFVVLEDGRKRGLCVSRWTQRWGAASSFRAVVDGAEGSLGGGNGGRGVLVVEEGRRAQMAGLLVS